MKNRTLVVVYLLAGCVLPLAPRSPELLWHFKILILMAACMVMLGWANPPVRFEEGQQRKNTDRGTMLLIFALGYVAWVAPIVEWGYFLEDRGVTSWTIAGLAAIIGGLGFRIWALRVLGRYFTGVVRQVAGQQLVTKGPYRLLRHPSYLGSMIAIAGCAILLEAWSGLAIAIACMAAAYYFRIRAEEELLVSVFGDAYKEYQQRTWRLAPGIW